MIKNFTLLFFLFASITLSAQNINIPDANFKKALVDRTAINTDGDGEISESEAVAFTGSINIAELKISDLTGIEYFINATGLHCSGNNLIDLDITNNKKLKYLNCYGNKLKDITLNAEIIDLDCAYNDISNLDISKNSNLESIRCSYNDLTNLDVSNNTKLDELNCESNNISKLDISNNTIIKSLNCESNNISELEFSENSLISIECDNNKFSLSELIKIKNHYTDLNYTSTKKIFSPIKESSGFEIDYSSEALIDGTETVFTWYDVNNNVVEETFISKTRTGVYKFQEKGIYYCKMTNSKFPNNELTTESVYINYNAIIQISDANFKKALVENTKINTDGDGEISESEAAAFTGEIDVRSLGISNLVGFEYFIKIKELDCSQNKLNNLDLSKNPHIRRLVCSHNQLTNLDLTQNPAITSLSCESNQLTSVNLNPNTIISYLDYDRNLFPFSELLILNNYQSIANYTSSGRIFSPLEESDGFELDYSSEAILNGTETIITWYDNNRDEMDETVISKIGTGIYKFTEAGSYHCKMTNAIFPGLELTMESVYINKNKVIEFPDANFKKALVENTRINYDKNSEISECEAADYKIGLVVSNLEISNLKGIEYFINITALDCRNNQLSSLNTTQNTKITRLYCNGNQLSSLDLAQNTKLNTLSCQNNQLKSLDVSTNTSLRYLTCNDNLINTLDLSKNTIILELICYSNQLSSLDLNQNTTLKKLECYHNQFPFSELQKIQNNYTDLSYSYPKKIFSKIEESDGYQIDYSVETIIDGKETVFTWYDINNNLVNETSVSKEGAGIYKFIKPGIYYCMMTNETFPEIRLTTEYITINNNKAIVFTDANFKKELIENSLINTNGDEEISEFEAALTTSLLLSNKNISDLTGIEYFCRFKTLNISDNDISSLDLNQNTLITDLNCNNNLFPLSELLKIKTYYSKLSYTSTKKIFSAIEETIGFKIDYSSEALIDGKETIFTWYDSNNNILDETVVSKTKNGIYKPLKLGTYYCKLTNTTFPNTELIAEFITIKAGPIINIPDANFKKALIDNTAINTDGDGEISEAEAMAFTGEINLLSKSISDLTGIEYFTNITSLDCSSNQLKIIDVSQTKALTTLKCGGNQLSTLETSQNTALTSLSCLQNQLTQLDISKNTTLTELVCGNNPFVTLDVSNNTALTRFSCVKNQLSSLDVSKNIALTELYCISNQLTALDLSQNMALNTLYCSTNLINTLDLSKNTALTTLGCSENQLKTLDLSKNTALTILSCHNNKINSLDLSKNTALTELRCNDNQFPLSEINKIKTHFTDLVYTSDQTIFEPLTKEVSYSIDYSTEQIFNSTNTTFSWHNSSDETVDESFVKETDTKRIFEFLQRGTYYCTMANATLTTSELKTENINIYSNDPVNIPDANFKKALIENTEINTNGDSEITEQEASSFIDEINVNSSDISDLTGIEHFTNITKLECSGNQLTNLYLGNNNELTSLNCASNQLTNLDLKNNTKLTDLNCFYNDLSSLELSSNIINLYCHTNKFPFSELFKIKQKYSELAYGQSKKIFSEQNKKIGFIIDYSSEVLIDGNNTNFIWYKGYGEATTNEDIIEENTGVFKFLKEGTYYCEMTNASFPGLTLKTNKITISQPVFINIPDANFKKALVDNTEINTNGDAEISESEAEAFTGSISVSNLEISDLTGLEYFFNITELNCYTNQLSNLNVSANTQLTKLDCDENKITSLDLSNNINLKNLSCRENQLSNLNLSKNINLIDLDFANNQLTTIDINANTNINRLFCYNNKFTSLDLRNNQKIEILWCSDNELKTINIHPNCKLTNTSFYHNVLPFSELIKIKKSHSEFTYFTNKKLFQTLEESEGFEVDYSKEAIIDGIKTIFSWYASDDKVIGDVLVSEVSDGIFKFNKSGRYYCEMTNESIPDTKLNTHDIIIDNHKNILFLDPNFKKVLVDNTSINANGDSEISEFEAAVITDLNLRDQNISDPTGIEYFFNLKSLRIDNNQLTRLNLTENSEITYLECSSNKFPFSELQKIKEHYPELNYSSDKRLFSSIEEKVNYQVDYSSEVTIGGNETTFTWFNNKGEEVSNEYIAEENKGIFNFLKEGIYECRMTNESFPDLTLTTNNITTYNNGNIDIPDTNFKNALIENSLINIDGNSEITEYEAMIYKSELDVSGKGIANLQGIEYFLNLKVLKCQDNKLASLYIENNNELEELDCSGNQLQYINLPNKLESINCSGNLLIIFDISNCTELTDLDCSANEIDDLDIRSNKKLENLNCSYNDLNKLSLTESNSQLIELNIDQNHLPLSELNKIKAINPVLVVIEKYSPDYLSRQFDVFKGLVEELENEIDFSAEALFNEKETTFTWTTDYGMTAIDESTLEVVKPGVFKFLKTGMYHCEMTNEEFPDIVVTTSEIQIFRHMQEITFGNVPNPVKANDVIELSATATSGLEVTFELVSGDASIDGKTITFNKEGTVIIKANQAGNDEYKPTEAKIEITVDIATGINDVLKSSIQIYPNPVITDLNISFDKNEDRMIYIYDLKGQIRLQQKSFSNSEHLNISDFKSGMYILKIQSESGVVSYKILKN
ncbi:T9SS type A sorting domain-containing protein [Labilibaculum antarcticum]|uniref:Secretion system C-terminal sorting domain-containing protein n=1 Tax=Labilibaculum antarcticum TaxID=1717717 RepID=A0A1Y1CJY9_9BACT|nr:T9SS type A sorting domain-containing protein [Labilibaculum antarcticum]BAX80600.1 hypothetical protein ALGA_2268 [Labilibaculum antarcticum]